jgi:hypothetical protein
MPTKIRLSRNASKPCAPKTPTLPAEALPLTGRRKCKPAPNESAFSQLPFVHTQNQNFIPASNWHVPPTDDYSQACKTGREYAAHFAQYLKDNPDMCGANTLGIIARDIDFKNTSATAGYWVGFFSHLERIISAQAQRLDVYHDVDAVNAYYAEMEETH